MFRVYKQVHSEVPALWVQLTHAPTEGKTRPASAGGGIRPHTCATCLCMVLWLVNSAYVAGIHTPAKPVRGRHVAGTVVL